MIEIEAVGKTYPGGVQALCDVSFAVRQGQVFGLLGINGAGKTTLIRIISTLLRPTSGRLRVFGLDAAKQPERIRRRMGVVSQELNLDGQLTVRQNLMFQALYFGLSWSSGKKRVAAMIDALDLESCAGTAVYTLSGGTRRKVMIARALLPDPDLLVLDEPTAGLDPLVRARVWEMVRTYRELGKTVLLSTHHFDEAQALCDRVGTIHHGRITCKDHLVDLAEDFARLTDAEEPGCLV